MHKRHRLKTDSYGEVDGRWHMTCEHVTTAGTVDSRLLYMSLATPHHCHTSKCRICSRGLPASRQRRLYADMRLKPRSGIESREVFNRDLPSQV